MAQKEWDADTFAARTMMRRGRRALLEQHVRWLAVTGPAPLPPYAPWLVLANHVLAVEAEFTPPHKPSIGLPQLLQCQERVPPLW